jgi:UDP-N-acetylmuramate-alanine ligase
MKRIHFIGIGGSGLSAIARLLKESGYEVTGSDRVLSQFAADLQNEGIAIYVGHHPRNVGGADLGSSVPPQLGMTIPRSKLRSVQEFQSTSVQISLVS